MPEDILVVEYEPRYADRVRQALSGQPFTPFFAKDGEEALRVLEGREPRLIVLSSVIPKVSTADLIRQIRERAALKWTPILITVSGYNGKTPQADAVRLGASDILPKPYTEAEFLGKIQTMLGSRQETGGADYTVSNKSAVPQSMTADEKNPLTSNDIFGDLLDDDKTAATEVRKPQKRASEDLDQMLADTLSGVRVPPRKKLETVRMPVTPEPAAAAPTGPPAASPAVQPPVSAAPVPAPPRTAEQKARSASDDLDKLLENTLSGLEKTSRPKVDPSPARTQAMPMPKLEPPAAAPASAPPVPSEKVAMSAPILAPQPVREAAPLEEEDPGGIRFGHYALLEKIAMGGMAEVWKARMRGVEGFQKIVAIKKILPHLSDNEEFVTMFVDEAKLAAQLSHNNIIHIYDLGKIANSYYIAMEYIDGHDLKTILKRGEERGQPFPIEIALFVASKIASALDYAHRKRDFNEKDLELVHRDVSPQNVLISHEGDIKLCDFGIAKAASKASHTQAGALKGKLQYMSPEQAWGKKIDRRSDIFALSAVLFEMLSGRKLFTGDSEISILEQVREARVTPPSEINDEVTPDVDAIVLKALQKDPDDRYQTAGEMARDLDAILYAFRPTPTSADLAIYMHRIYSSAPLLPQQPLNQAAEEPEDDAIAIKPVILTPAPPPRAAAAPVVTAPAAVAPASYTFGAPAEESEKKFPVLPVAIAAVVAVAAIGGYLATRSKPAAQPPATSTSTAAAKTAPAETAATAATTAPLTTSAVATTSAPAPAPGNDQAKIDQEVKRRLDAERQKLEQQKAQQLAAAGGKPAPAPSTPASKPAAPAVAAAAPASTQSAAPPPAPATVAESRPAPPPVQEAPKATVHEGDLVQQGAEGLVPPELVRQFKPPYPSMARDRRVEGMVVVSALIAETGQVVDVKVIKGVPLLNEAAIEAVRRSTFRPATKDGVKVKSYKTITLPFKL